MLEKGGINEKEKKEKAMKTIGILLIVFRL